MPTQQFNELAELAAEQFGLVTLADARSVGYRDSSVAQLARRGQLDRVSQGVYRVPFLARGLLGSYLEAALWPVGVRGVLSHETALELWEVSDVNPSKTHITVPRAHRTQRDVPVGYVLHGADLGQDHVTDIEGVPVVTLERAIRDCAADHLGLDLLEQAVRNGRARGLLTDQQASELVDDLGIDLVAGQRA